MTDLLKVDHFESIRVDSIGLGASSSGLMHKVTPQGSIEKLVASIEKWGLLHPILVTPTDEIVGYEYELIAGQKRLLAHKSLDREMIQAAIVLGPVSMIDGENLAANENINRTDMSRVVLIDVCENAYKRYGSMKAAAEQTGLPLTVIRKFVRMVSLPEDLRERVQNGELNVHIAMKVRDAAINLTGTYDQAIANEIIEHLKVLDDDAQRRMLKEMKEHLELTPKQAAEAIETTPSQTKISFTFVGDYHDAIQRASELEGAEAWEVAFRMITEGLSKEGFLEDNGQD